MCLENNAEHSVEYFNAQLESLWNISAKCAKHYENVSDLEEHEKYTFALAQYSAGKGQIKNKRAFSAKFAAPTLEFICNHDVILSLTITEGYLDLPQGKSSSLVSLK